ncbi:MAG: class I SAM-dependent methyltransferase family protein [Candidatus Paceibacterota bacterium]
MNENITVAANPKGRKSITFFVTQPIKKEEYEEIRWPYYASLPLMWLLTLSVMAKKRIYKLFGLGEPRTNSFFFDGLGVACRKVKEYAASWRAMDLIYNHTFPPKLTFRLLDEFYWYGLNCQALRNRYKLVKHELKKAISNFENQPEIRLASLACGAGQAIIETIAECKARNIIVRAILMDIDQAGLDMAQKFAEQYGVADQIKTHKINLAEEDNFLNDFKPQIIEMLGFLDYANQETAISFVKKLYSALDEKGILITCNINSNVEQYFIKWAINWPMVYRKPAELMDIARKSGFNDYQIVFEPLKIHSLLIAKK